MMSMTKSNTMLTIDDKVDAACLAAGHKKVHVFYSAYKTNKKDQAIDNLEKIAAKGKIVLVHEKSDFFGGEKSKNYISDVLENPTWLQVAVCANAMIKRVKDKHHVFLEGISNELYIDSKKLLGKIEKIKASGVKIYQFVMGS